MGRDSTVGIATRYELDGPGIECRWRFFRTRPERLCGAPSLLHNGYSFSFLGVTRRWRGVEHPFPSSAEVILLLPLLAFMARSIVKFTFYYNVYYYHESGGSVGIAIDYVLDGPGIESRPDLPWGPPSLLYNGYRVFPGGKVRPGRAADHSPPSSAVVMEE